MMWRSSEILGYGVRATDGAIGSVQDFLFDDQHWTIRWAVIDTGAWLPGRKVLLPPSSLGRPDATRREFPVDLTRDRIENGPEIANDAPVSRQMEVDLYGYYGWTPYWTGWPGYVAPPTGATGGGMVPPPGTPTNPERAPTGDPHLRSAGEVTGYYIQAKDGDIGHVEEFLIDEDDWAVRYLVVDTRNWWPGKTVLVSPQWALDVSWSERRVFVDLMRQQIKDSPEYDPQIPVDRRYEERLHGHYGRSPYWARA